jgi:hypothetical protein
MGIFQARGSDMGQKPLTLEEGRSGFRQLVLRKSREFPEISPIIEKPAGKRILPEKQGKNRTLWVHKDFDGAACAVLISAEKLVGEIKFTSPAAVERMLVPIKPRDIVADLPFPRSQFRGEYYDHHEKKPPRGAKYRGKHDEKAPSAARLVYEFYDDRRLDRFSELVNAADKVDSGRLTLADIMSGDKYLVISVTLRANGDDSEYMGKVVQWLRTESADRVLREPEFRRRYEQTMRESDAFADEVTRRMRIQGGIGVIDLRGATEQGGPNFVIHTLYPKREVFLKVTDSPDGVSADINVSYNLHNGSGGLDLGKMMGEYGGGGHEKMAGCRVGKDRADLVIGDILRKLGAN